MPLDPLASPPVRGAMPRRAFIHRASVLGSALALSSAASRAAVTGEKARRYALVGTGGRSRLYVEAIGGPFRAQASLVGLCDKNPGRLNMTADRIRALTGAAPATCAPDGFEAMLAATKAETVIVTTMDSLHHEYIVRAMLAGCDVIVEKPLTTTPAQCQEIIDARNRTGRSCRVTFNLRYSPVCHQVKDLLMRGEIGEVLSVDFHWLLDTSHGADYFRRWHATKANSGGLMIHKASHHFDLVNWWLGAMPQSVFATGKREFYVPAMAKRMGLAGPHERCRTCPEAAKCGFYFDLRADPIAKNYYLDHEHHDGYWRDRCVFRPEIDIEDTMNVLVRYDTGATLAYSLNAFNAWEGYIVAFNGSKGRLEHSLGGPPAPDGARRDFDVRTAIIPLRGPARVITPWKSEGSHLGGDIKMLEDLLLPDRPADPCLRAADERAGAASALVGMAANRCFTTGQPVEIASLVRGLRAPDYAPMPTRSGPVPMPPPEKS